MLKTDYIDVYQFHLMGQCYKPGDGTGMYECMLEAKAKGLIKHIGGTAHKLGIKTFIHEQNSVAGKANLMMSDCVDLIGVSLKSSESKFQNKNPKLKV